MLKKYSSRKFSTFVEDNLIQLTNRVEKAYTAGSPWSGKTSHQMLMEQADEIKKLKEGRTNDGEDSITNSGYRDPQRDLANYFLKYHTNDTDMAREMAISTLKDPHYAKLGNITNPSQYRKELEAAAGRAMKIQRNQHLNQVRDFAPDAASDLFSNANDRIPMIENAAKKSGVDYDKMLRAYEQAHAIYTAKGGTANGFNPSILNEAMARLSENKPLGGKIPVKVSVQAHSAKTAEGKTYFVNAHMRTYWVNMADKIPEQIQQKVATEHGIDPQTLQDYTEKVLRQQAKFGYENFMSQVGALMKKNGVGLIQKKYAKQTYDTGTQYAGAQRETMIDAIHNTLKNSKWLDSQKKKFKLGAMTAKHQAQDVAHKVMDFGTKFVPQKIGTMMGKR